MRPGSINKTSTRRLSSGRISNKQVYKVVVVAAEVGLSSVERTGYNISGDRAMKHGAGC
jgi:hypothetical protein